MAHYSRNWYPWLDRASPRHGGLWLDANFRSWLIVIYNSITWWRHQMETFSALMGLSEGIHRSPVDSPHRGQWRGALMFSLMCAWRNGWPNHRDASNLIRHSAHCDVTLRWIPTKKEKSSYYPESLVKLIRCVSDSVATKLAGSTQLNFAATRPYTS